jgi:hypothetical protein
VRPPVRALRQGVSEVLFARWCISKSCRCPLMSLGWLPSSGREKMRAKVASCPSIARIWIMTPRPRSGRGRMMRLRVRMAGALALLVACASGCSTLDRAAYHRRRLGDRNGAQGRAITTGLECNRDFRSTQTVRRLAPAGTSVSIRARRTAFDKGRRTPVARFVVVLSAQPTASPGAGGGERTDVSSNVSELTSLVEGWQREGG